MRINGTTKSLVVNHLAESAAGVITIRAFKKEDQFFTKNLVLIDTNSSPFFHSFSANEWLIQWIEMVSSMVFASAALCMVLLPSRTFNSGQYTFVLQSFFFYYQIFYSLFFGNIIHRMILNSPIWIFNHRIHWVGTFLWSFHKCLVCPYSSK